MPTTSAILRPAILIISDTAAKDPSTDKSGPILSDVFSTHNDEGETRKWENPVVKIVKDEIEAIQKVVKEWTEDDNDGDGKFMNLIITSGGTGFARRDFTPEAVSPLLDRLAPGLVHAMLSASFQITPFAMMSRPVAGVRNKTIILTLPGSPKGAKENLEAVLKLLPHACMQAAGEDSRTAHSGGVKKLEKDAGVSNSANGASVATASAANHHHDHSHHHHHHDHSHGHGGHKIPKAHTKPSERPQSNDPRLGATSRARSSPYPMLSVDEALSKIIEQSPQPTIEHRDMTPDLVGAVIAEDIKAAEAVPAYRASIVDGYAVIVPSKKEDKGIKGVFPVASVSHAQASSLPPALKEGEIARITTGAPLPENANAVVMVEDTVIASTTEDQTEEATVEILTDDLEQGENIREPGSDIKEGSLILSKGTRITSIGGEIGLLAASGTHVVPIYKKPKLGVMSTGDEVIDISYNKSLSCGMIRDSNRPSLLSLIRSWNLCQEVIDLGIIKDTPENELEIKIRESYLLYDLDIILTTGGVSMGELDLLKPTIERKLGGTIHFGRVSMKPGKPTTFATIPFKSNNHTTNSNNTTGGDEKRKNKLLFGLPGNPASALVTANLFLLPCLQKFNGYKNPNGLEKVKVKIEGKGQKIKCDKDRIEYHRVVISVGDDQDQGILLAKTTGIQRSSRVGSLASSNGLLILPQKDGFLEEGEFCDALLMGNVLGS